MHVGRAAEHNDSLDDDDSIQLRPATYPGVQVRHNADGFDKG